MEDATKNNQSVTKDHGLKTEPHHHHLVDGRCACGDEITKEMQKQMKGAEFSASQLKKTLVRYSLYHGKATEICTLCGFDVERFRASTNSHASCKKRSY